MTTAAENEILTRTGPGTPMGELMRNYWIPAMLSSELKADGEPVRIMLLNEKLVAFRDTNGKVGVMDHRCPHRCASLFFGRNEEGGIRCVYHGWKFDADGNCTDMANVPPHQDFKHKVHAKAYKTAERNGLVYVYMGDQSKVPELPPIEACMLSEGQADIRFVHRECNWLQAAEGELDTSHIGFLHFGMLTKTQMAAAGDNRFAVVNRAPEYKSLETDFGYMYAAYRPAEEDETYWRLGQFLFPFWTMPPIGHIRQNLLTRAYVPLDDNNCMLIIIERRGIVEETEAVRPPGHPGGAHAENYVPNTTDWMGRWRIQENRANDYMINRDYQRQESYTGMDTFVLQDQMITESMGEIADRTLEHLAPSDVMITRVRRCLVRAAQAYAKDKTLPANATDAEQFKGVRGGFFVAKTSIDWTDAYKHQVESSPLSAWMQAAE